MDINVLIVTFCLFYFRIMKFPVITGFYDKDKILYYINIGYKMIFYGLKIVQDE